MNEETKRTDPGKLIDADAFLRALKKLHDWHWTGWLVIANEAASQPDASEPLRKRIAELEGFMGKVANAENSLEWESLIDEAKEMVEGED